MDIFRRHRIMFSPQEMEKLQASTVYIAGAGGLGSNQVTHLQRIGVKKIYLTDIDVVDATNLNRQICYGRDDIGKLKTEQARAFFANFKLPTAVETLTDKVEVGMTIPEDVDLIMDALDNFTARLALEKAAVKHNLPLIHGGVHSWYGQVTTIIPGRSVSLADLFGDSPLPRGEIPCLAPVVAIVASLQVLEAVKVILGHKDILVNKLLLVDLKNLTMEKIDLKADC